MEKNMLPTLPIFKIKRICLKWLPSLNITFKKKKNVSVVVLQTYADKISVLPIAKACSLLNK